MPVLTKEHEATTKQHSAREVKGQLFVFDTSLYRNLYRQLLDISNGDRVLARKYTRLAIINDGGPLVQENISSLRDERGRHYVDDDILRAKMQLTPTKHEYYQTVDPRTGQKVITNEEYLPLGASITTATTLWRRGNDRAVMRKVEDIALGLGAGSEEKVNYTLFWASPKAEKWENEMIKKYNGEYGYLYVGYLTEERGVRKLVVHSFKADSETATFARFMSNSGGEAHHAGFEKSQEGVDDVIDRPFLDHLMRTVTVIKGGITNGEVITRLYQAQLETQGLDKMFDKLGVGAMLLAQDSVLRSRIETEVATPVADWLVEEIMKGTNDRQIQDQARGKFIDKTISLMRRIQRENVSYIAQPPEKNEYAKDRVITSLDTPENRIYLEQMRQMTQLRGGFCGDWDFLTSDISEMLSSSVIQLKSFGSISGGRLGAGGFTRTSSICKVCQINAAVEGGCGYCKRCEHKAA